jgi:hypothetical protein
MENVVKSHIAEVFEEISSGLKTGSFGKKISVGITLLGSEHGECEILKGAEAAQAENPNIEVVVIGPKDQIAKKETKVKLIEAATEKEAHEKMDALLLNGELDAAVTMHYNFPIGISTVGRPTASALWLKTPSMV